MLEYVQRDDIVEKFRFLYHLEFIKTLFPKLKNTFLELLQLTVVFKRRREN